ncbi:MAG: thioredoxin family protein [Candidatus Dependentiae bacterium]|nr:thioredoxin family protein [Candidatus Dependentiae bacterium]
MKKYIVAIALLTTVSVLAQVKEINSEKEFNDSIAHNISIVKFYTPECPNCQGARVTFERASEKFPHVHFIAVNTHDYSDLADTYKVSGLPTFSYFKDGKHLEAKKHVGNSSGLSETFKYNIESLK